MNPDQLWETTIIPARRKMIKVTMADAVEAERMFVLLMGEQVALAGNISSASPNPSKTWIFEFSRNDVNQQPPAGENQPG